MEFFALQVYGRTPTDVHDPIIQDVGYHIREGIHGVIDYDWDRLGIS